MERNLTVKNTLRYIVDNHEIQNPYIIVPRRFFFFFLFGGGGGGGGGGGEKRMCNLIGLHMNIKIHMQHITHLLD
jgi:hypothetical protein